MKSIKSLKPSRASRYVQGYINPRSCKKLINRTEPVIYRSSYEKRFIMWCESSSSVRAWGSEGIAIPYITPDGAQHTYYPDFFIEQSDGTRCVIEIKPSNQTVPPVNENAWARREWVKNSAKWAAAAEFCKARGMKFKILTEQTVSRL